MTLPLQNLHDRSFAELLADAQAQIAALCPEWTDHNPSDPGIALLELFAWLSDMLLYRLDRAPEAVRPALLRLLRGDPGWEPGDDPDADLCATLLALRERYRAVSAADYADLVQKQWSGGAIRQLICLPGKNLSDGKNLDQPGHLTLAVMPEPTFGKDGARLIPDYSAALQLWLDERRLLGTRLHVIGPRFADVSIVVEVTLRPGAPKDTLDRAMAALRNFYDPLDGGPDGRGWPFGRGVYRSDTYRVLEGVRGIDYVRKVTLTGAGTDWVQTPNGDLVPTQGQVLPLARPVVSREVRP
jgi:hypothetical protein